MYGCLVTWFCYQLITKPANKTAVPSWLDPPTDKIFGPIYLLLNLVYILTGLVSAKDQEPRFGNNKLDRHLHHPRKTTETCRTPQTTFCGIGFRKITNWFGCYKYYFISRFIRLLQPDLTDKTPILAAITTSNWFISLVVNSRLNEALLWFHLFLVPHICVGERGQHWLR